MRKRIAWITAVFVVVIAASVVAWSQDEQPGGGNRWQGQEGHHQFDGPAEHRFGGEAYRGGFQGGRGGFGRYRMMRQHRRGGFGGGRGLLGMANNPRVRAYLNLTDAQVTRLHEISVESEKANVKTGSDLELRGIELHELLRADNPDRDAILRKVQEVSDLRGQMAKQHMETMLTARSVLTPEQIKKVRAFMEGGGRAPGGPGGERPMGRRRGQGRPPGAPPAPPTNPPAAQ